MIKILIIDDSIFTCNMITKILNSDATEIISVNNAAQAFKMVEAYTPDVILLDMVLPDMDGFEVCFILKNMQQLKDIPVVFLTSNNDEKSIVRAFESGAADYIFKPFSSAELKARVFSHAKSKLMADQLKISNLKLEEMMEEIKQQGYKDPLTNIYNRKYIIEKIPKWKKEIESGKTAFVYLIDIDGFKTINDTYGHCTGDYVLCTIADLMRSSIHEKSTVCRWGGDEFLVFILNISPEIAEEIGNTIIKSIREFPFEYDGYRFTCSGTIGVAPFSSDLKIEENLKLADKALYYGKESGKNCCIYYHKEKMK